MEQSAAADRGPQYAARQQQPAPVAADRLSGPDRADGIFLRHLSGRLADARPAMERGDIDQARLRVRAGNPAPAPAGLDAAADEGAVATRSPAPSRPPWQSGRRWR